ncbi:tRNA (adenosine(37)-N6)-dimethylallyltransferase MiaA [Patescibacteria group bacterium]|nr:tRNA (adenosine(37)-N6)-dimethylallyltransferase MiaA [Patescibacteria group bacterium]MBU1730182.1 tRNA (adenosine(37)-N6)-dimethylallyltransferase MiaA [Patescibacteria group bacterium]MBU2009977.1 tRNA (adenosine(37)-N6)-dimethylallyltransferase MiaA [Patescibacteria group bacterium]MBU2460619.1 tRNA (adenosine(37)-N6)-dimethylallyltransferase MiaA [Patescibacteria group bacterium]
MKIKQKIIAVVGPTSSGKSDLAVLIAKKFGGEIISADSRQVYKGMDLGTGKITKKEMGGIPHHLLDIANPKRRYSVAQFNKDARRAITEIQERNKIPILCGGTGFYIQAITSNYVLPSVKPNKILREKLEKLSTKQLAVCLNKLDPQRAKEIDPRNPHRLIRAIEIATELGKVPLLSTQAPNPYNMLQIGIITNDSDLKERIKTRLLARIRRGMFAEAKHLHTRGVSWKRMEELGLEYKYLTLFLQNKLSKPEMIKQLNIASWQYAKRQKTWFKRDKNINWFSLDEIKKIENCIKQFLNL